LDGSPPAYHWDKGVGAGINNWLVHVEVCPYVKPYLTISLLIKEQWHNAWTECQKKEENKKNADTEATFLTPNCKIIPFLLFLL
jgi:hypothetical protein